MGPSSESGFVHGIGHSSRKTRENLSLAQEEYHECGEREKFNVFWSSQMAYEITLKIERPTKLL
jgi:hypothetical protein